MMRKLFTLITTFILSLVVFQLEAQVSESLRSGSLPAGWSESSVTFTTAAGGYANFTATSAVLTSPILNVSAGATITFDVAKFGTGGDGPITVEISNDGGTTWTAKTFNSPTPTSSTYVTSGPTSLDVSGGNIRIRFIRTSSPSQKRLRDVVITNAVLPIDLESFTAKAQNNQTRLDWATATEQNSSHFLIQRSVDGGRKFETIGQVAGQGDSNERVDYTFVDEKPAAGTNYYRLHQFDYDGTNEIFGPVSVTFTGKGGAVRVWPTLAESELTIETAMDNAAAVLLSVYDLNGRLMQEQIAGEKALQTTMSVANLPAGAYFIRWQQGSASGQVRFVKL